MRHSAFNHMAALPDECRVKSIQVTLDGPDAKTHDATRHLRNGGGTFDRIMSNIATFPGKSDITVRCNVHKGNAGEYPELEKRLLALDKDGDGRISVYAGHMDGHGLYEGMAMHAVEYADFRRATDKSVDRVGYVGPACMAPKLLDLVVDERGNLCKCLESVGQDGESFGNIRDFDFADPQSGSMDVLSEWLDYAWPDDEECLHCPLLPICLGGCPYCYAEGGERHVDELDAQAFLRITQEAAQAGFGSVVIVGGEPLVYRDFQRYLDGLGSLDLAGCSLVLRTSFGFGVSDELMEKLCATFDEIVVSIDGDEAAHDAIRGKGTWRHATGNSLRALAYGGRISVNSVMTREQSDGAPGSFLRSFCTEHGIEKLVISSPVPMGRAEGTDVPPFEWRSDAKQALSLKPKFSCGLGHSLYMQPDGSVYPCYAWCGEEHRLGDLSREPLASILERGDLLAIANTGVDTNEKCRTCEVRYFCGGICKIYVRDKHDLDSGDFDCAETKNDILRMLEAQGVAVREGGL